MTTDEQAARLEREAAEHKRAVRYHRDQLRRCKQRLAELRQWCDANGIRYIEHRGEG